MKPNALFMVHSLGNAAPQEVPVNLRCGGLHLQCSTGSIWTRTVVETRFRWANRAYRLRRTTKNQQVSWGCSCWHRRGRKFNPCHAHHFPPFKWRMSPWWAPLLHKGRLVQL